VLVGLGHTPRVGRRVGDADDSDGGDDDGARRDNSRGWYVCRHQQMTNSKMQLTALSHSHISHIGCGTMHFRSRDFHTLVASDAFGFVCPIKSWKRYRDLTFARQLLSLTRSRKICQHSVADSSMCIRQLPRRTCR
jgi:hypothetical protein